MTASEFTVQFQWHAPDAMFAAGILRDGQPWILNGALVGMGATREQALGDLVGTARQLVVEGQNFLTSAPLTLADREWLFAVLEPGERNDAMYRALREARTFAEAEG